MKKLLTFATALILAATVAFADEQQRIKLDDEHAKRQIRLGYCNIFVTKVESDNEGNSIVTVEIENLDETNAIILFGHAYPEKELKKLSPSIKFDKRFPGTKGHRLIDTYREARNVIFLEPSDKCTLPEIHVLKGDIQLCRLPLYIAKYKNKKIYWGPSYGKNKMLLMEKQIIELEIEVDERPDKDYVRLEEDCNVLIEEISKFSKPSFCNHPRHKPSLHDQEQPYKDRIDSINTEIDKIISLHNWYTSDKGYQRYSALKQRLATIDLTIYEGDCGRHKRVSIPVQTCKYCNLTPQQIYHKLDDYYKKIYSSNDRKAAKESVMGDVNLLYGCRKHSASWKKSEYNSKITDRYSRISNF